ncbi:MAG: hypothetical protein NT007_02800 [Candidatus Kapabacteria bacterium]|nr:hypothetical protein [Candidatus Kapabacteria bacterium]
MRGLFLFNIEYDYAPFGSLLKSWGSTSRTKFLGKEKDNESALNDLGVRKYDDGIGRFVQPEPLWEKYYSVSPYVYSLNNPIGAKDPNGKWAWIINNNGGSNYNNSTGTNSGVQSFVDANTFDGKQIADQMNDQVSGYAASWNSSAHYAPNVAQYFIDHQIGIGIAHINSNSEGGEFDPNTGNIAVNVNAIKNIGIFAGKAESIIFHEIVHKMGYGEFGAYSAQLAAGYLSNKEFNLNWEDMFNDFVKSHNIDDFKTNGILDRDKVINEALKTGRSIIGE